MATEPRYPGQTSEYGGSDDRFRTPDGSPRALDTSERARLLRTAGIHDRAAPNPDEPYEYGERMA
ncbi:hypothetical protein ACFT30_13585 [Microbacterium ureisolvens]|uniref:hypothetical protein n=1 Tax=Microbacterium ureisolvens TaxID=2781186 RepID=UPI00364443A6